MGYTIIAVFEYPSSESKADTEEIFWKTVEAGDVKELKERAVDWKVKPSGTEGGSFGKVAKTQIKELFFGAKKSNGQPYGKR